MAGRFVLLYFGEEDRAQQYIDTTKAKVVGVYEDPKGKTCTCRSQPAKDHGYGPHHNYWGWQVHPHCGNAGKWWRRGYGKRLFLALGVNLLGDKAPEMLRSPQGWGHESYNPEQGDSQ